MRRRMIFAVALVLGLVATFAVRAPRTQALQAYIEKMKSDCQSLEARITLVYNNDDRLDDPDFRDYFQLEIHDFANNRLHHVEESITWEQSPFFWRTGRLTAAAFNGKYRVTMWDRTSSEDDADDQTLRLDEAWTDCTTGQSWREIDPDEDPQIPDLTCFAWVPLYSTNLAPESGAVIVLWSFFQDRFENWPIYEEYHLTTMRIEQNEGFEEGETWLYAPCGTYLKIYFEPDSTKLLYRMHSQYWPHDSFGVPQKHDAIGPTFYTYFPLDGPVRDEDFEPTLAPTATFTPVPSPTFTATPEE